LTIINRITYSIHLEEGTAEGRHLEDIEEQRLVGTDTDLERLGIAGGILELLGEGNLELLGEGNLVLPEGVRLGSLVRLDKQGVVGDRHLGDIVLRGMAEPEDNLLALPKGIAACRAGAAIGDKHLGNPEEDIEVVIIMDSHILQHQLELPLYILEVAPWDISELQRLEQLQWELSMLHQQ
jgi:hypothetical protein